MVIVMSEMSTAELAICCGVWLSSSVSSSSDANDFMATARKSEREIERDREGETV